MARPKTVKREEQRERIDLEEVLTAEQLNPALDALYSELGISDGQQATVYVSLIESDGIEARVWNGIPDDYNLETIAKTFGSGNYRVKLYVKMPIEMGGKSVVQGNRVIRMKLSREQELALRAAQAAPVAPALAQQPTMTPEVIAAAVANAIRTAMPPPQPAPDYLGIVTGLAGVMTKFIPAAPANPAPGINPVELLKLVVNAVNDSRRNERDVDDEDTPRRGKNAYDFWGGLIEKALPMFQQALHLPGGAVNQTQMLNDQPLPVGTETAAFVPAPGVSMSESDDVKKLRQGISFLIAMADGGHDPTLYAEMVVDQVPEESLIALLAMPDPVGYLTTLDPRVATFKDWFNNMLKEAKEILDAPDEGDGQQKQ